MQRRWWRPMHEFRDPLTRGNIMRLTRMGASCAALVMALATHQAAMAQGSDADALMALDLDSLTGEIRNRFDGALAASNNPAFISADDTRYVWSIEAKAQCGITLDRKRD